MAATLDGDALCASSTCVTRALIDTERRDLITLIPSKKSKTRKSTRARTAIRHASSVTRRTPSGCAGNVNTSCVKTAQKDTGKRPAILSHLVQNELDMTMMMSRRHAINVKVSQQNSCASADFCSVRPVLASTAGKAILCTLWSTSCLFSAKITLNWSGFTAQTVMSSSVTICAVTSHFLKSHGD